MYPLTPFHYLLEALLTLVEHDNVVKCKTSEFALFTPPSGQTCAEYAGTFVSTIGGYLNNPTSTTECQYCSYATGDEYTATLEVYWDHRWRDYGIFWAYVIFNVIMIFILTGLYCGGLSSITGIFKKNKKNSSSGASGDEKKDQLSKKGVDPVAQV